MEERVQQFHTAALAGKTSKTLSEIAKLRNHRFAEKEQSRLFQSVQLYVTMFKAEGAAARDDENPATGLVEDALKMPFTVFSTAQKKTMLKWLDEMAGAAEKSRTPAQTTSWTLVDVSDEIVTLLSADGAETLDATLPSGPVGQRLAAAFDAGDDVVVSVADGVIVDVQDA